MPANTSPIHVLTPNIGAVSIATANANLDGTGTIGTLFTAGSNGSRIDYVFIKARVTTTAGVIRFFLYNGATYFLLHEELVTAITASGTVAAFEAVWIPPKPIVLASGWSLRVSTEVAETFNVSAHGGDY